MVQKVKPLYLLALLELHEWGHKPLGGCPSSLCPGSAGGGADHPPVVRSSPLLQRSRLSLTCLCTLAFGGTPVLSGSGRVRCTESNGWMSASPAAPQLHRAPEHQLTSASDWVLLSHIPPCLFCIRKEQVFHLWKLQKRN